MRAWTGAIAITLLIGSCRPARPARLPTFTAEEIIVTYEANALRGDQRWNDRWQIIEGMRVDSVTGRHACMQGARLELRLMFPKSILARLWPGDIIAASCEGDGMRRNKYIYFERCRLTDQQRPSAAPPAASETPPPATSAPRSMNAGTPVPPSPADTTPDDAIDPWADSPDAGAETQPDAGDAVP